MKKWFRKLQWRISRWWYRIRLWFGWWYCEKCENMHSPLTAKYDFQESEEFECYKGVYDVPVLKEFEDDPEYFRMLKKDLHRVG